MLFGQRQKVFLCHTFEACIGWVGRPGELGRFEPVVQGLGMNPKQSSTRSDRKCCHDQDSFQIKEGPTSKQDARSLQEMSRTSQTSRTVLFSRAPARMRNSSWWRKGRKRGLASIQTTFGMKVARSTLMASAPSRPRESSWHVARSRPDEMSEQMTHFRNSEGQKQERLWLSWRLHDSEEVGFPLQTNTSKVGHRQHDQRHMYVIWNLENSQITCIIWTTSAFLLKSFQRMAGVFHIMPVPPKEAAHFIVVQPQIFGVFKLFLDMPSGSNSLHHLLQGGAFRSEHQIVAQLLRIGETATDQ